VGTKRALKLKKIVFFPNNSESLKVCSRRFVVGGRSEDFDPVGDIPQNTEGNYWEW
jgi:hypothetical protein